MKRLTLAALGLVLAGVAVRPAYSQAAAAAAPSGLRGELIAALDDAATKLQQLAQAIPQEKATWRPGVGVRSVSEVCMHVVGGNYLLASFAGVRPPAGAPGENGETSITDRAQVIDQLRRSFEHVRAAIRAMSDADLDKPTEMFGEKTTYRGVYLATVTHAHEHLGQLIAYARMNGVTPPWSMATR